MRHRDVAVIILHENGKVLLQKRSKTARRFPGSWGFFGGGIEAGENALAALRRELVEELDLAVKDAVYVKDYDYVLPETGEEGKVIVFRERYDRKPLMLHEGDEMRWVSPPDALALEMHPVYRRVIEEIVQGRIPVVS